MNTGRSRIPRLMVAGASSGVGKSLFMTGLIVALRKQGMSVSCCVTGSALHQALIYTRLARRYSYSIDRRVLEADQIISTIHEAERGADIVLIDGNGGFYDGEAPGDTFGSDADIAHLTHTPVLLVADVPRYSNSLAALVKGFCQFSEKDQIQGIVANRVMLSEEVGPILSNPVMESINVCMRSYGLPNFVGGLPDAHFSTPIPPAQCSQGENATALPREFFLDIASLVSNHVDISALVALAELAPELPQVGTGPDERVHTSRIAVSDDLCFNVGYQDNLAWLTRHGAQIVTFSPLTDNELPKNIGAVYMTGGYLDTYGPELARNERIRESIKEFALRGGVLYSEGAGTAYLCGTYQLAPGGALLPGVGLIDGDAIRVQHQRGMVKATLTDETILGSIGAQVCGLSTGEWTLRGSPTAKSGSLMKALRIVVADGTPYNEGISSTAQSLSTFHFLHFGSNPMVARALVDAAAVRIQA